MPDTDKKERKKIEPNDLYKLMWECRNLEIDNLWKRSAFLATLIVIFWTGLGYIFFKYIDLSVNETRSFRLDSCVGNCFLLGIQFYAVLASFISMLWICMTKGSKAWVEFFEGHIDAIKNENNRELYFSEELKEKLDKSKYIPYNGSNPEDFDRDWSNNILIPNGGAFSPSRVNIIIGIISFLLFSVMEVFIFIVVLMNRACRYTPLYALIILLIYSGGIWLIYYFGGSRFLSNAERKMKKK